MTHMSFPAKVLLLGNYRPALTVARSLAAQGHEIWVSRDDDAAAAHASRAVTGLWNNPPGTDAAIQYAALAKYLYEHPDISIVFPLLESYVRGFYEHRHLLPEDRLYVMPNREAVEICTDKARLLQAVTDAGLPCARNIATTNLAELRDAAAAVGFPLIVKPADSTIWLGTRKALILSDQAAFDEAFLTWPDDHQQLIVQTYVNGPRLNLYFAAQNARAISYTVVQIGQTDIPDGTGLATDGVTVPLTPEVQTMGDALIAQLDYHGVGCIQFLRDRETGEVSFLEINPRIGGNHAITDHCNMGLDRFALSIANGDKLDGALSVGRAGVRYAWTIGALRGADTSRRNREIGFGGFISRCFRAVVMGLTTPAHITFRWSGPKPSLTLLLRALPGILFLRRRLALDKQRPA